MSFFLSFSLPGPSLAPFYHLSFLCSLLLSMKLWLHIWPRVVVRPRNCWFLQLRAGRCVNSAGSFLSGSSSNRPCSSLGCRPARFLDSVLLASPRRGRWFRWKIKIRCFDSAPRRRHWSRCPRRQLPPRLLFLGRNMKISFPRKLYPCFFRSPSPLSPRLLLNLEELRRIMARIHGPDFR